MHDLTSNNSTLKGHVYMPLYNRGRRRNLSIEHENQHAATLQA